MIRQTLLLLAAALPAAALAADADGRFKIDGVGSLKCDRLVAAMNGDDATLLAAFASWTEGFVTGVNAFQPDTFDVTPWQTTPVVLQKMKVFCQANPDTVYIDGLGKLIAVLKPARQTVSADLVQLRHADRAVTLPSTVLAEVRTVLEQSLATPLATPPGGFDDAFSTALIGYQSAHALPETGLPDQATLNAMFP